MSETVAQLLGEYNRLTGNALKRFPNKAEAIRLVTEARAKYAKPRSLATKAQWRNKKVAKERATRTSVIVQGHGEFASLAKAFNALNLPRNGRIRFRMALKAAGMKTYTHEGTTYTFCVAGTKKEDHESR